MSLDITEYSLRIHLVRLTGRVDALNASQMKADFKALTRDGHYHLIIDLREVTLIDSSGLGLLSSIAQAARGGGGEICVVVTPDSHVHRALTLVRFDKVLGLYSTPEAALHSFTL